MENTDRETTVPVHPAPTATSEGKGWYAVRVLFSRWAPLLADLERLGWETFRPGDMIPSLLFIRCSEAQIASLASQHSERMMVYRQPGRRQPAAIPEREMEIFRFVVTAGRQGLTLLGEDRPEYHQGDRVMVTQGPFKGAEGHIKRIKKDRRLVVTIPGVVAVATAYIHPDFLKKID
ncbi:MAG: KOW motif-containing protein [Bacteroidales bacterium]|nr:KOW motif-containing protein [Bacteroidales bacterium]